MQLKKNNQVNLEKKRSVFLLLGTLVSLTFTLMAFEYTVFVDAPKNTGCMFVFNPVEEDPIPVVVVEKVKVKPSPPKVKIPSVNAKPVEKPLIDVSDFPNLDSIIIDMEPEPMPIEPIIEDAIPFADEMPIFPGGEEALFAFLSNNIVYPHIAVSEGITGRVYLTFVVGKEGEIIDVKVLRGLGAGCTEEALRVVNKMPRWKPGKHQGKTVKVQYNLPIKFDLK